MLRLLIISLLLALTPGRANAGPLDSHWARIAQASVLEQDTLLWAGQIEGSFVEFWTTGGAVCMAIDGQEHPLITRRDLATGEPVFAGLWSGERYLLTGHVKIGPLGSPVVEFNAEGYPPYRLSLDGDLNTMAETCVCFGKHKDPNHTCTNSECDESGDCSAKNHPGGGSCRWKSPTANAAPRVENGG